jgi:hypothetical protein
LFGEYLERLRLAGARGACDEAVPVDGSQRDAHLSTGIYGAVNDDAAQLECLTLDGVSGGYLLGWAGSRLRGHGSKHYCASGGVVGVVGQLRLWAYC